VQRTLVTRCLLFVMSNAIAIGIALSLAPIALAEDAWVRDEIRLNIRTGASTQNRIVGVAKTGDAVRILKRGDGWTQIRLVEANKDGWIPNGYLQPEPPPGVRLASVEAASVKRESAFTTLRDEVEKLRADNKILSSQDGDQQSQIKALTMSNMQLRAGARYPEWITGACIFAAGMVLGAMLHRNSSRRQPTRIRL
jgi:hypothetical protein